MRGFGFLCLFMLIGTAALMHHGYSSNGRLSSNPGMVLRSNDMMSVLRSRKLKDNLDPPTQDEDESHFNLEDYRPIDPVPSSKASIRPGPVQHGTPLMPYIPKPSPTPGPGKPQHGG